MSMIQTVIGGTAMVLVLNFAVGTVLPDAPRIEVHGITYADGRMTQDRSVFSDAAVFQMHWTAEIRDAVTGNTVPWCQGSGNFAYQTGRHVKTMPLAVWVGNDACTPESLPPGKYEPLAVYSWGDKQIIGHGEVFEVTQ